MLDKDINIKSYDARVRYAQCMLTLPEPRKVIVKYNNNKACKEEE